MKTLNEEMCDMLSTFIIDKMAETFTGASEASTEEIEEKLDSFVEQLSDPRPKTKMEMICDLLKQTQELKDIVLAMYVYGEIVTEMTQAELLREMMRHGK